MIPLPSTQSIRNGAIGPLRRCCRATASCPCSSGKPCNWKIVQKLHQPNLEYCVQGGPWSHQQALTHIFLLLGTGTCTFVVRDTANVQRHIYVVFQELYDHQLSYQPMHFRRHSPWTFFPAPLVHPFTKWCLYMERRAIFSTSHSRQQSQRILNRWQNLSLALDHVVLEGVYIFTGATQYTYLITG